MNNGLRTNGSAWVLVDVENPLTTWEIAIGRVVSACCIGRPGIVSQWHYWNIRNAILNSDWATYFREVELEQVRQEHYPRCVSRLTGVFLFPSEHELNTARVSWRKSSHRHEAAEIGFSAERWSRHDSNWLIDNQRPISEIAHQYWRGEPMNPTPLWEVIASGKGCVWGTELKTRCYIKNYHMHPRFSAFLKGSTALFLDGKEFAGITCPFISVQNNNLNGSIIFRDQELKEFDLNEDNPILKELQVPVHPDGLTSPALPDFREYFFSFTLPQG